MGQRALLDPPAVDGRAERLQTKTAAELHTLIDKAFKGELQRCLMSWYPAAERLGRLTS